MSEWRKELDDGNKIGVVFIDFKRAFETIDRQRLIKKLKYYRIDGNALKWFESYLENRTQQVKFGDTLSTKRKVKFGVPQGSILGPILFLLYINDIISVTNETGCTIKLFADDTMLYFSGKDEKIIEATINKTLMSLDKWLNINSLKANCKKTVFMLISDQRKRVENEISINI